MKRGRVDFYLLVLYHIKQGLNPTQIAKKHNISKQRISYYINGLKAKGLIKKVGYGTWETTEKTSKNLHKDGDDFFYFSSVRGHGFQFKLILPRKLRNWEKRVDYLIKKEIPFKLVGYKSQIPRIYFKKYKIWLCKNSIIVYYPEALSFFSDSAENSKRDAVLNFHSIIKQLERVLKADFKIGGEYVFEVPKRHYALTKNELAGHYIKDHKKIEIRDRKGELWALIDNSLNLEELEQVHPKTAERDTDVVVEPFMNLLRENPKILQEIILNVTGNTRTMRLMQEEIDILVEYVYNKK